MNKEEKDLFKELKSLSFGNTKEQTRFAKEISILLRLYGLDKIRVFTESNELEFEVSESFGSDGFLNIRLRPILKEIDPDADKKIG